MYILIIITMVTWSSQLHLLCRLPLELSSVIQRAQLQVLLYKGIQRDLRVGEFVKQHIGLHIDSLCSSSEGCDENRGLQLLQHSLLPRCSLIESLFSNCIL